MHEPRRRTKPGRMFALALGSFVVVAPELLGGATETSELLILIGATATALACAFGVLRFRMDLGAIPLASVGLASAALWTFVQSLRLPCAWVSWAQPARTERMTALVDLGAIDAPQCSLSLAPGASRSSLALACAVLALSLASTALSRAGHRDLLLRSIAISSMVMACVAAGHGVFDAHSVFGLYAPLDARGQVLLAPLMNGNHLAGHLALGFPLCIAFALRTERIDLRILWGVALLIVCATCLLSLSRGGTAALFGGGLAYSAMELSAARESSGRTRGRGPLSSSLSIAMAALSVGLGLFFGLDLIAKEFEGTGATLGKLSAVWMLVPLILQHPFSGVGRGALPDVSASVFTDNHRVLFAENLPVHWLIEWGVPATIVIVAFLAGSLLRLRLKQDSERALACGFVALVLQNLVDFSLELAGVACVAAVSLGVLTARERAPSRLLELRLPTLRTVLVTSAGLSAFCTVLAAPWLTLWGRDALTAKLQAGLDNLSPAFDGTLETAFEGYPLDPMFVVLGAAAAVRRDGRDAPRWLNLAFAAAPGWAAPHIAAAWMLEKRNLLDQAALELSLATERSPGEGRALACDFVKRHPSATLAWDASPESDPQHQSHLEALVGCLLQDQHWREAEPLLQRIVETYPKAAQSWRRWVQAAANLGQPQHALECAQAMLQRLPESPLSAATLAETLTQQARAREALQAIDRAPASVRRDQNVLIAEARAAAAIRDSARVDRCLLELLSNFGGTTRERAGLLAFASAQLSTMGNHLGALAKAQAAYDLSGDPAMLELAHQAAVRGGVLPAALRTASQLCHVRHRGETYCRDAQQMGLAH